MAAGGISKLAMTAAGRIAVGLRTVDHKEAYVPFFSQFPCSGEARNAGAEDGNIGGDLIGRRRQGFPVTQVTPFDTAGIVHRRRDFLPAPVTGSRPKQDRRARTAR